MNSLESSTHKIQQFLTFELAGEAYGVEILKVQEIRGWTPVRKLPNLPEFVKGALNLRGVIVPIIDLRERFQMSIVEYTPMTVVIVVRLTLIVGGPTVLGIIADAVSDVVEINWTEVSAMPSMGSKIDTRYMYGMYMRETGMVMLLDVEKLLSPEEYIEIIKN
jgi:purine-binding chemotaxis protein CheW